METPNYYSILTADVRYCAELSASEKLFFSEITALATKDGYCFASNSYFSKLYDVNKRTISAWINKLNKLGFIEVEMIYNDKVVEKRKIYPIANRGIEKNLTTYGKKSHGGYRDFSQGGIEKNLHYNNINTNNININRDDDKGIEIYHHIVEFYENNIGQLAPLILDKLKSLTDEWTALSEDAEKIILLAFEYAVGRQAANKFSYAQRILDNWQERNLTTLSAIQAESKRKKQKQTSSKKIRKDSDFDWSDV